MLEAARVVVSRELSWACSRGEERCEAAVEVGKAQKLYWTSAAEHMLPVQPWLTVPLSLPIITWYAWKMTKQKRHRMTYTSWTDLRANLNKQRC
jgi:hypothetical protein